MWIDGTGQLYDGDMVPGDREATQAEVDAWNSRLDKTTQRIALQAQIDALDAQSLPLLTQAVLAQITSGAPIPISVATQLQSIATQKAELQAQLAAL